MRSHALRALILTMLLSDVLRYHGAEADCLDILIIFSMGKSHYRTHPAASCHELALPSMKNWHSPSMELFPAKDTNFAINIRCTHEVCTQTYSWGASAPLLSIG